MCVLQYGKWLDLAAPELTAATRDPDVVFPRALRKGLPLLAETCGDPKEYLRLTATELRTGKL